jgi:hypothetical protein
MLDVTPLHAALSSLRTLVLGVGGANEWAEVITADDYALPEFVATTLLAAPRRIDIAAQGTGSGEAAAVVAVPPATAMLAAELLLLMAAAE